MVVSTKFDVMQSVIVKANPKIQGQVAQIIFTGSAVWYKLEYWDDVTMRTVDLYEEQIEAV
jgi:hypothetical protein